MRRILVGTILLLLPAVAQAEIRELRQTVFGMD